MSIKDYTVDELEHIISTLDTLYEEGKDCIHPYTNEIISDATYDLYRQRLQEVAPNSKLLATPTASTLDSNSRVVTHNPPMTSISKAIGSLEDRKAELQKFFDRCVQELGYGDDPEKWAAQAYKRDGVAVSIYYKNGKLHKAGLRPRDGINGEDVTENIKYVFGVPEELWIHDAKGNRVKPLKVDLCIRGELECLKSKFKSHSGEYANPRNFTSGSIRQFKDPTITKDRDISFVAYKILGYDDAPFVSETEMAKWCNRILKVPYVRVMPFRWKDLQKMEDMIDDLDYEVDGIVVSVNNLEDSEQMGTHGNSPIGNPRGKIAWKFSEQAAETKISHYVWTPGRTGKLTPVIHIDPVKLDGTTVSRCTGHSYGFMKGTSPASIGEMGEGAIIRIIKSGKIIPKPIEIVKKGKPFSAPTHCPSCSCKLSVVTGETGQDLVCTNTFCGERAISNLTYYFKTVGAKGLAKRKIENIYEAGLVKHPADFYRLTIDSLTKAGFSERQSILALANIWLIDDPEHKENDDLKKLIEQAQKNKLPIPSWIFFASLGIPGAGKTTGRAIASHYIDIRKVANATAAELENIDDVGSVTAEAIFDFYQNNGHIVDDLLNFIEPQMPKQGKFSGKTFVFTGGFPEGKAFWEQQVENKGGNCSNSVSKTTDYVVVGTNAGSKEQKADKLGIAKLSKEDLEKML